MREKSGGEKGGEREGRDILSVVRRPNRSSRLPLFDLITAAVDR